MPFWLIVLIAVAVVIAAGYGGHGMRSRRVTVLGVLYLYGLTLCTVSVCLFVSTAIRGAAVV